MDNLLRAHQNARKGKGWYQEVKEFEVDLAGEGTLLPKLQASMLKRKYQTSAYERFIKNDYGKSRIIYRLPYYPDRICQWAILQVIEPYLINSFTADTYSAIPGRGIHSALEKMEHCMRTDIPHCQYCLKMKAIEHKRSIGKPINYTDFCSFHSYDGWLKSCNSFRLKAKYMEPLNRFVDSYYQANIKGKKGCNT